MDEKNETFLINITVSEGRHYAWPNMDSYVEVKVGKEKKYTPVQKSTDTPHYHEYYVFEIKTTLEKLLDYSIKMTVVLPRACGRKQKTLGFFLLDVATVWAQPDRQFYQKWAILNAPLKDAVSGTRGYLKVNIAITAKGEVPRIPEPTKNTDDVEGNLLLSDNAAVHREWAKFIFQVYWVENLVTNEDAYKNRSASDGKTNEIGTTAYVEIHFAGSSMKTSVKKKNSDRVWNERLIISEPFPPLCQRIKIQLHTGQTRKRDEVPTRYISLSSISSDREQGFLPTFGPSFLHFYDASYPYGYVGCVLLKITIEVLDVISRQDKKSKVHIQTLANDTLNFPLENIYVFAGILEVNMIPKRYRSKPISFRITQGHINAQMTPDVADAQLANATPAMLPKRTNKSYWHLGLNESKPCIYLCTQWPDTKRRMFSSNMLNKMTKNFKAKLDSIQEIFCSEDFRDQSETIENELVATIDILNTSLNKCIDLLESFNETSTDLDKEKATLWKEEMGDMIGHLENMYNPKLKKKCFRKLQDMQKRMEAIFEDAQDNLPDIYIWMFSGRTKVGCYCIPAKDLIYNSVEEVKGEMCGVVQYVFLQPVKPKLTVTVPKDFCCQMKIILWLGPERHISSCIADMPSGFSVSTTASGFPNTLRLENNHKFQLRAHIFQGRFTLGADKTGLCDPFVEVTIDNHSKATKIIQSTLNPVWDQTLNFSSIELYGSKSYIKDNPPQIFLEVLDLDECRKRELVGRAVVYPTIKFIDDEYTPSTLKWISAYNKTDVTAEILAGFELLQLSGDPDEAYDVESSNQPTAIPLDIKPELVKFKIEVLFWGMRDLKKVHMSVINKPRVTVLCSGEHLHSDTVKDARKNPNFTNYIKSLEVIMPIQEVYIPPITLKLHDSRNFGIYVYAGAHVTDVKHLLYHPLIEAQRLIKLTNVQKLSYDSMDSNADSIVINIEGNEVDKESKKDEQKEETIEIIEKKPKMKQPCFLIVAKFIIKTLKEKISLRRKVKKEKEIPVEKEESEDEDQIEMNDFDWWTKFYASLEPPPVDKGKVPLSQKYRLKIYNQELEKQPEFHGFTDMIQIFKLYKGKRTRDELVDPESMTGIFKGSIKIYQWPLEEYLTYVTHSGQPIDNGVFQDYPNNAPLRCLLRVYCVRGLGLRPHDLNGKSDPYLVVSLGNKVINDRENRVMRQLNPVFGRCFEFNAIFPFDHTLTVAIWDYDMTTKDDLVGETKIDVENRFYTFARANCGLPESYQESGYCEWRDQYRPTVILENLCKKWMLFQPVYDETSVTVGPNTFQLKQNCGSPACKHATNPQKFNDEHYRKEVLALLALRRWHEIPVVGRHFVPEHVETRSLYDPRKPGIEQGKMQLWIDIFSYSELPPPRQVDIAPRKPVPYELRVIIWNVEGIALTEDDFFLGEKKSDIYVKGWVTSPEEAQFTDVHYKSLTGEGNFNWRFVFSFNYLLTENKVVIKKKDRLLALGDTEYKEPCKVTLQVWDNDVFSKDDFLGTMTLELAHLPRGAPMASKCVLFENPKTRNLFKIKRTKGWWPFTNKNKDDQSTYMCGKLEAEFELMTAEEAKAVPVGLGRDSPNPLPKPNRPDVSFSWLRNPLKALKYFFCKLHCKASIITVVIILLILGGIYAVYSLPNNVIKKVLGF